MKKIYSAPLTEVVKINAEQVVCSSEKVTLSSTKYNGSSDIQSKDDEDYDDFDSSLW